VKELAQSLKVDFVTKIRISDAEVVDLLNRAAAMVYTSYLEPFGFAPLEANACATPVVAIAEGGVRETILDEVNGILISDRDPAAIGSAILRLLEEPALAQMLGERARELVMQRWSWQAAIQRLDKLLLDTVNQNGTLTE